MYAAFWHNQAVPRARQSQLIFDKIAVMISPKPNPHNMQATKASGDDLRKNSPKPMPVMTPPPMAQVLLSFLFMSIAYTQLHSGYIQPII